MNDSIDFYIQNCLVYMVLSKNALRLYCQKKDNNPILKSILNNLGLLINFISKTYFVTEPSNDLNKACIKCAIQRLNDGRAALKKVTELDNTSIDILKKYDDIILSLVNYILAQKNGGQK